MRNWILVVLFFSAITLGGRSTAQADIIFSLVQRTPSSGNALSLGSTNAGLFEVYIRSTVENQQFLGVDFTLNLSSTNGAGGRFVSGANLFMQNSSNPAGFVPGTFNAPGAVSATFSTIQNTSTLTLGTTDTLLASLTLSTVGATAGNYTMNLSGLDAIDWGFNQIRTTTAPELGGVGTLNYSAVPEPSALILSLVGAGGLAWRHRKRLKTSR